MTLAVATPIRGGTDAAPVALGYARFLHVLAKRVNFTTLADPLMTFSLDTVRARNRLAGIVLREMPRVDAVLWLDDDQWPENSVDGLKVIDEMLATGAPLIGAPYTNKAHPLRWTHQLLPDGRTLLGFGFTITTRACLEKMSAAARQYTDHPRPDKIANIFGQLYSGDTESDSLLSEDYSFCLRWSQLGGQAVLYEQAGIVCHAGAKAWSARDKAGGVVG